MLTDHPQDVPETYSSVHLTPRELDVLALAANGLPNAVIAERLGIGLYTVKSHVKSLMAKLHARTRFEAVVNARRANLIADF